MIKLITWIDDGREEVTTMLAMAEREEPVPVRSLSWELLHQNFVARLDAEKKET